MIFSNQHALFMSLTAIHIEITCVPSDC